MKTTHCETAEPDPWDNGQPRQRIRIEGLISTSEPGVFELNGVTARNIDWPAVREALDMSGPLTRDEDDLMDALSEAVWMFDIKRILAERIKPA